MTEEMDALEDIVSRAKMRGNERAPQGRKVGSKFMAGRGQHKLAKIARLQSAYATRKRKQKEGV